LDWKLLEILIFLPSKLDNCLSQDLNTPADVLVLATTEQGTHFSVLGFGWHKVFFCNV
jgi:hypothetical protein